MKFIDFLSNLKETFSDNYIIRKNDTVLLGPDKIPKSKHMLFKPLVNEYVNEYLIAHFSNLDFPKEYIDLLKFSNGANLFGIKIVAGKFSFANYMFVILGLPLTPPFERSLDMEEPYDIRVENLARHKMIPKNWIKCAIWNEIKNLGNDEPTDIFIDTITHKVFACKKNQCDILYEWNSLDECFCSIVESFKDLQNEYQM